jgi:NRAMP (natural resistance-associated macrophage protein)-like metal ion transporter
VGLGPARGRSALVRPRPDTIEEPDNGGRLRYLRALGPGLVTGAADDDPSGIATYAQAGSLYRYDLLWTLLLCLPLLLCVQVIADRTALASGKSLGALALEKYASRGRKVVGGLLVALLMANILNVAADVAAIGAGMSLLHAGSAWIWALIGGLVVLVLLMKASFPIVAIVFDLLALSLLSYVGVVAFTHPHWLSIVAHTIVPHLHFNKGYATMVVAILGTTISPYMLFWQSGNRIEEMRDEPAGGDKAQPLRNRTWLAARFKRRSALVDVLAGMTFSQIVAFSIVIATADTLGIHHTPIASAAEAASSLRPFAGRFAEHIFALGFIGSGMLAIPVLVGSASIGISGLLGKQWGFSRSYREAPFFYWLIIGGTALGTVLSVLPINIISLLVICAVVNGLLAPAFIVLLMLIAGDAKLTSDMPLRRSVRFGGWLTAAVMGAAALAFFVLLFF